MTCRYHNTAEEPSSPTRSIAFIVNDGLFNSTPAIAYVTILPVNDAPLVTLGEEGAVDVMIVFVEDQQTPLVLAPQLKIQGEPKLKICINCLNHINYFVPYSVAITCIILSLSMNKFSTNHCCNWCMTASFLLCNNWEV